MNRDLPHDSETLAASPAAVVAPDRPPANVPGYDVREFVGKGAYGQVWTAVDRNTGRKVAIKFFAHRKGVDSSLLSSEVEKLVFLSSDRYVVQLLEVGWDAEPPYYVMEYVEYGSLNDRLRRDGPIPVSEAVELFREVAIGLSHAHSKGILHCDLKPANILLDQDDRPRLADFGQSRLSGEQSPALGTLFYMAPEQADLGAVPDASWDVYALGSLMYCMLTGTPVHRTEEALSRIESAEHLSEQLQRYAQYLKSSPVPDDHRRVPGVDRALADIIDQCLAHDPDRRYPNVFAVLQALDRRDAARHSRPLWILGLLGPLLLFATFSVFGYRSYQRATIEAEHLAIEGAKASNEYAARFVARNVSNEVDRRFRAVMAAANDQQLVALTETYLASDDIRDQLNRDLTRSVHNELYFSPLKTAAEHEAFASHPNRQALQEFVQALLNGPAGTLRDAPPAASWFVTDARGTHLAAAFRSGAEGRSPIGVNYAWRTYFHGGTADLDPGSTQMPDSPIQDLHLSAVFRSSVTLKWKVAVSAPIRNADGQTIGVIAMTVDLGEFVEPPEEGRNQFAVVVDGREGDNRGVILQHPLYDRIHRQDPGLSIPDHTGPEFRIDLDTLRDQQTTDPFVEYVDPVSRDNTYGGDFAGQWIASVAPVNIELRKGGDDKEVTETGLWVVVQGRMDVVTAPVAQLAWRMLREAVAAVAAVLLVSLLLWWLVRNMMRDSLPNNTGRMIGEIESTMHSRETLEQPKASKSR